MNIAYLCNYMLEDVMNKRRNSKTYAQAANNKIEQIAASLILSGHRLHILSSGLTNNRSAKWYKGFRSEIKPDLYYASIFDLPLINSLWSALSLIGLVRKLHKQQHVDAILFWNYKPEVALAALYCKLKYGIKMIVDYEDGYYALHHLGRKTKIFTMIEKFVSRYIDGAILISKHMEPRVKDKPCFVLPGITNQKLIRPREQSKKTNDPITLMYAGGLDYERGIDVLLDALKYTAEDFKLIITGKGPRSELLKNHLDPRIHFLGFLDYEEIVINLHQSDILVNPQREGIDFAKASFPSKIFDYIATGNVIVSSNVGDMRSFSNDAFYIYENDDPVNLSAAIDIAILDIKSKRCSERIMQIERLRDRYSPAAIGNQLTVTLFS